jgi:hypothetical protein
VGVPPANIQLTVTAASVRVVATIRVNGANSTDALAAAYSVATILSSLDAAEMSTRLLVDVEQLAPAEVTEVVVPAPMPPPAASPLATPPSYAQDTQTADAGLVAGVAVGVFALALALLAVAYCCVYKRSGKGGGHKIFLRKSDVAGKAAGKPGRPAPRATSPKSLSPEPADKLKKGAEPSPEKTDAAQPDGASVLAACVRPTESKAQPAAKPVEQSYPNVLTSPPSPVASPSKPEPELTPVSNIRSSASIRKMLEEDNEPLPKIALVVSPTTLPPLPADLTELEEQPLTKQLTASASNPRLPALEAAGVASSSVPTRGKLDAVPLGKIAVPAVEDSEDEEAEAPVADSPQNSSSRHSRSKPTSRPDSAGKKSPMALIGRRSERASRVHPTDAASADDDSASSHPSSRDEGSLDVSPASKRLSFGSRNSTRVRPAPSLHTDDA